MLILLLSSRQLDNISLNDKKIYLNVNFFFLAFLANSNLYLHFLFNYFMNLKKSFLLRLNPVRILGSAFLQGVRIYRRAFFSTQKLKSIMATVLCKPRFQLPVLKCPVFNFPVLKRGSSKVLESAPIPNFKNLSMMGLRLVAGQS